MECEICGKEVEEPVLIEINGTTLRVCRECSKFGTLKGEGKPVIVKKEVLKTVVFEEDTEFQELGEKVKKIREAMKLNQQEFAKAINISLSSLKRIERGENLDKKELRKIKRAIARYE